MGGPPVSQGHGEKLRRLAWLLALWLCSVAALGLLTLLMRLLMGVFGMGRP